MFTVEIFNQFGVYEKKIFDNKSKYLKFLKQCSKNPAIQMLEFTDHSSN